ncbi:MAG: hypothetical protein MJZ26_12635 [Fibrobacter sp.]|nr:hypothetical protein [Fibrobacter sp.]
MRKIGLALIIFLAVAGSSAFATQFVAVLETISNKDSEVSLSEKMFITDELRKDAVQALADHDFSIMTRENIQVMLPPEKSLEDCEGSCLVETGRNIAADYIVQGRIGKFGNDLTLTVELYETSSGRFLGSITSKNSVVQGLLLDAQSRANDLFKSILPEEEKIDVVKESYEEDSPTLDEAADVEKKEHLVPRWVPWLALSLGAICTFAGYMNNKDLKYAKREYDEMSAEYSKQDFDEKWRDIEYTKEARDAFYWFGGILIAGSVVLFVF